MVALINPGRPWERAERVAGRGSPSFLLRTDSSSREKAEMFNYRDANRVCVLVCPGLGWWGLLPRWDVRVSSVGKMLRSCPQGGVLGCLPWIEM